MLDIFLIPDSGLPAVKVHHKVRALFETLVQVGSRGLGPLGHRSTCIVATFGQQLPGRRGSYLRALAIIMEAHMATGLQIVNIHLATLATLQVAYMIEYGGRGFEYNSRIILSSRPGSSKMRAERTLSLRVSAIGILHILIIQMSIVPKSMLSLGKGSDSGSNGDLLRFRAGAKGDLGCSSQDIYIVSSLCLPTT